MEMEMEREGGRTDANGEALAPALPACSVDEGCARPYAVIENVLELVQPGQQVCMLPVKLGNLLPVKVQQLLPGRRRKTGCERRALQRMAWRTSMRLCV